MVFQVYLNFKKNFNVVKTLMLLNFKLLHTLAMFALNKETYIKVWKIVKSETNLIKLK